ncbi:hypothetical protein FRC14_002334 [Serendipita sp. 396]|nr:hypothetical protein FRC14_002334 [Serendipita sp. 396]KAG8788621.1 hypothetical protein FRC15_003145 [Serendipita sp. 397]KAG8803919.1 hypothetical protein FRC16_002033 [Serendipita sp. 398]KAG8828091.1 hypothetical protein FRC19_009947 [Serendipita sp. 401]KAG8838902.1 hypothetical protein FRC18_002130 [Serendipita sp. 400]KAG8875254.1 hypothetical protein FRC20_004179 [Serendipita sp. 405]KAG9058402.1 hypothetical protein FS842_010128 [Serendipita sp. 407]
MSALRLTSALPKRLPIVNARGLATIIPSHGTNNHHHPLTTETLHTTGKVHSLGHQHEYIPNSRGASSSSNSLASGTSHSAVYGRIKGHDGVWCVAGAAGETKAFGGVPMGAYSASETFSPAWRRSI